MARVYPPNSHPPRVLETSNLACSECVVDCNDAACTSEIDDHCTDQCVVVPCDIPDHDDVKCPKGSCESACVASDICPLPAHAVSVCEASQSKGIFCVQDSCNVACDDAISCPLVDTHERTPPHGSQFMPGPAYPPHAHPGDWDPEIDPFLCCRGVDFPPQEGAIHHNFLEDHYLRPVPRLSTLASPSETNSLPSGFSSPLPLPTYTPPLYLAQPPAPAIPPGHICLWNGCGSSFSSREELVSHVNTNHLPTSPSQLPEPLLAPSSYLALGSDVSGLSCQWDNCHEYASIPVNSSGIEFDALNSLTGHVLHDHLGFEGWQGNHSGMTTDHAPLPDEVLPLPALHPGQDVEMPDEGQRSDDKRPDAPLARNATQNIVSRVDNEHWGSMTADNKMLNPVMGAAKKCQWRACELSFTSVDDLMNHLTAEHVGSGKNRYECFWIGCDRNGENGFNSKQKVCRHLQMHTGYKPFKCETCQHYFSEAATLQQHMRRHTQQKPYRCEFPGCEKAFAIAGALTIHRRTHTGLKPFKCQYCERAFAESSNLSKHLRTHTGARPYVCKEPGCKKTFARPDQYARHRRVHLKRSHPASPVDNGEMAQVF
ncbi:hypothetical protein BC827DRAFT_1197155 [Russula dissimulans]|nr:hypothetical protein BC827DRAFT_1197155 [Russula dissimulans]